MSALENWCLLLTGAEQNVGARVSQSRSTVGAPAVQLDGRFLGRYQASRGDRNGKFLRQNLMCHVFLLLTIGRHTLFFGRAILTH